MAFVLLATKKAWSSYCRASISAHEEFNALEIALLPCNLENWIVTRKEGKQWHEHYSCPSLLLRGSFQAVAQEIDHRWSLWFADLRQRWLFGEAEAVTACGHSTRATGPHRQTALEICGGFPFWIFSNIPICTCCEQIFISQEKSH